MSRQVTYVHNIFGGCKRRQRRLRTGAYTGNGSAAIAAMVPSTLARALSRISALESIRLICFDHV